MSRERARTMRSRAGRVNARGGPSTRLIRVASLLAIGTLVAAACTRSGGRPSSAEPRTEPSTTPAAGAVASACTPGSGIITTVAGSWPYEGADDQGFPDWRSRGDGGSATQAQLDLPSDVAVDASGNLYILETSHGPGLVRKVDPSGQIATVVGPPTDGSLAPGEASRVDLQSPWGIALDAEGNLYVGGGNGGNSMVVRVDPSGAVTTVAGTGEPGFSGDGGPATKAQLNGVQDVAFGPDGSLYIADEFNNRVRKVNPSGVITTFAGTGKPGFSGDGGPAIEARFNGTGGLALDQAGKVYIASAGDGRVRVVDRSGTIETVAGGGKKGVLAEGRPATEAGLLWPRGVAMDAEGNLYIADAGARGSGSRVRKVDPFGIITTVAGNGEAAFSGDGGPAIEASLDQPLAVTLGPDGALYIADFENARVRKVCL